jgi:hypothetical protein
MKRILSLDGGGIRGVFTLQVLKRIEDIFREARGRPALVLRDEFDFFAGTSTGAIIATCLAWGMQVREIEKLYIEKGAAMFAKVAWYQRWKGKYSAIAIGSFFREFFREEDAARSEALLGTRKLWVGDTPKYLLVVMRNASTGSPWPVCNNPLAKYNDPASPFNNLQIPLWKLLRASTAAPTYFPPEAIEMGGKSFLFVDGGITPYNDPALIAALMATLPCFHIEWPAGADELMVLSVGTGSVRTHLKKQVAEKIHLLDQATYVVPALLDSIAVQQDMLCRVMGDCRYGSIIDTEVGDLLGEGLPGRAGKKFSYVRYNRTFTELETDELQRTTKQRFTLDNLALIPFLQQTGRDYAAQAVQREHLMIEAPAPTAPVSS